ncbi:MAG TPA: tetratricopeptide repeat protein [Ktedonobacterales bacterium]
MGQTTLSESLRAVEAEIAAGRPDRAMALGFEIQSRYPRALAVQRVIGEIYLAQRKTREAIGALDRALAGNPEDARACCARAIVQQIHGNSMAALDWYRRACDINPDDQVLRSAYRELASHLGQPPYQPTRMGLARLYLRGDLFPHAMREFESLLAEQPDSLEAQVGLAETLWRAQRTQAAEERCRRILLNAPSCLKATLILTAIELDAGHADEAERLARRAAELDPDQRMARMLFADRFAGGDRGLRMLLLGPEPQPTYDGRVGTAPLSQPSLQAMPQAPMQAPLSTPQLPELPAQRMASGSQPMAQANSAAMGTGPLPGSITSGPTGTAGPPANGRSSALPPDFHSIFAETEYMLWGREDERAGRTRANPAVPPGAFGAPAAPGSGILPPITNNLDRSRVDPQSSFGRPAPFVPPAMREQGFNMEETEARAAINWINWLQAQGARPQGAPGQQMFGTGPLPPPPAMPTAGPAAPPAGTTAGPFAPPPATSTAGPDGGQSVRHALEGWSSRTNSGPVAGMSATGAPAGDSFSMVQTGPLPPAEELRAMFAQLQPDTSSSRIVEGAIVSTQNIDEKPTAELLPPSGRQHDEFAASTNQQYEIAGEELHDASTTVQPEWASGASESVDAAASASGEQHPLGLSDLYGLYQGHDDDEHAGAGDELNGASSSSHEQYDLNTRHEEPEWGGESAARATGAPAPITLEVLERGFAESGFQPFQLRAEEPSAEADGADGLASTSSIRELYGLSEEPSVSPAVDAPMDAANGASSGTFSFSDGDAWAANVAPTPEPAAPESEPKQSPMVVDNLPPDDHPARLERARQRRGEGQIDDALTDYRHVLRNAPHMLGDVVNDLEEAMADAPDHPEIHRLLGDARIRQGDYLSALESYNRAVALTQAQGS